MTTKRIIYTRPDGGVSVVCPAPEFVANFDGTEAEALAFIQAKDVPADAVGTEVVDVAVIMPDRTFRNAWVKKTGGIKVSLPKARPIHLDRIRVVRDAELLRLDIEYLKADEVGDAALKASIATEKQVLRDIPQTFDLTVATTPDELKALWPAELPPQEL